MASAAVGDRDASCTNDPNFAVICVFLNKFGPLCGLEYPNFLNLQNFIENTDEVPPELIELLVKLLRKNRYTVHPELWERALVKFCHTYSNQDAWEVERFGYKKSRLPVKLNILKSLLESQFDRNGKLKTAVGTMKAAELRSHPIGRDKFGNAYWSTIDNKACLIRIYQEHLDEETWQIVASNRDEFAKLIQGLKSETPVMPSLSDEDSSSNSINNNDKANDNGIAETEEIGEKNTNEIVNTTKVEVVGNDKDGEKENIILKITKNRITESGNDEYMEEEEEEEDDEELSKEESAAETNESITEPHQQARPSLLASKPPSKKPLVHPKKRANEIQNQDDHKKPKERLTLLGQQHKDKKATENDNMDEEEVEEEEEYSDEDELEEEEVEEEEEEEDFEGEEDPEVSEPIEDPVIKITGEGSGADNNGTFLNILACEHCESAEFSEVIEEEVKFFYGEGTGYMCQVGNSKEDISDSKPLVIQTESLKNHPTTSKEQTSEKEPCSSGETKNSQIASNQNNTSPNSSDTLDLSKPNKVEASETNHELKIELPKSIAAKNETPLIDKKSVHPKVIKNQSPERDKMETNSKSKEDKTDSEKNNIPPVLNVETVEGTTAMVCLVSDETILKPSFESKISNGAKLKELNNKELNSSPDIAKPFVENFSKEKLTVCNAKLTVQNATTSAVSSSADQSSKIPSKNDLETNSTVKKINSKFRKFKEPMKSHNVIAKDSKVSSPISESTEGTELIKISTEQEVEAKTKLEITKPINSSDLEKTLNVSPEVVEVPRPDNTIKNIKKLVENPKEEKSPDTKPEKEGTVSPNFSDINLDKTGSKVVNISKAIEPKETDTKNVSTIPSEASKILLEVNSTNHKPESSISSKDKGAADVEPGNINLKAEKCNIVTCDKETASSSKAKLQENENSPKFEEPADDNCKMLNIISPEFKGIEDESGKVIDTSSKLTDVISTLPRKTRPPPKVHKLEEGEVIKTENCIPTTEAEKCLSNVSQPSSTVNSLDSAEPRSIESKIDVANSSIEAAKFDTPISRKPEQISEESGNEINKTSNLETVSDPPKADVELNGIATPESPSENISHKVQLNQTTISSEPNSNDNKYPVPNLLYKPKNSVSESVDEAKVDVKEPDEVLVHIINHGEEIKIPEIKITEVEEQFSKTESETKSNIEPNHLKAPEIDTKDCNAKVISDAKDASKNIQSFSLDFNEDDESTKSDTTPVSTPVKRGRKPKPSPSSKRQTPKDPLEMDEVDSDATKQSAKKSGGFRKKRIDVEPALIIKEEDNETPVRQSRRIAQLKIREEAERRKLEEMVLKQMKADSDRKKKEEEKKKNPNEVDSDPDADIEEDEDEEESDSGSEKKILKKPKKKKKKDGSQPWQTSSGSSGSEDNDEELYIMDHEEDDELPPLKSDHEFSPESDMEDETQAVPTKRARTVKKDKPKQVEEEEEEDESDENQEHACQKCGKHDHPEWILLCDICDKGYHCSCLTPVLFIIPEGDWYCPPCQHQKLINIFTEQLEEFDAMIKQKELEENRKRRMDFANINAQNVLPISKKEPRARGRKKNSNRPVVQRRRKRSTDDDDDDTNIERKRRKSPSSSSSSSSSSSGDSEDSSDDEPIYKLRKRRQAAVSYRFNEFDDLINSAIKDEMDEVKGAGNLGRGKDISTIIEADKEEKRLKEQDSNPMDVIEEPMCEPDKEIKDKIEEPKTEDMDLEEPESKKILNDDDLLKDEDEKQKSEAESETSDIIRRPIIVKRVSTGRGKKRTRKLNSLDIESDDDGSDEDFKGSSSDSEDEEELSVSSASESSLENKWSKKKKKKNKSGGRRLRQRRRRMDEAFIDDNSDDSDEIKRPVRKRKKKEESDFSDFDDDDDEEEDVDSDDLCDSSTDSDSDSDGAWKPKKKRRKTNSKRTQNLVRKRPAIMIHRKKTKKLDDDEKSFKVGMTKKKIMTKPDNADSEDETKARKTRGRKITYLDDFDESSDDGIRPGVKRPDTPPEERALFIKKQEEIKRMLAAKNTDAAKVMATPVLKPLKSVIEEPLMSDSISTVPKQIIQNAKVLDPDFLKNKQSNEFDEEFDDQLPEDFDPEDMDEEEIAKMMEEEDFAQQQLKLAGEAIRNKKLKEAELNRRKELEKLKPVHISAKPISETIISPNINTAEPIGPTPLTQLQTIQPPRTSAPMMSQTRPMIHPPSSILSHGNPLPPGMHPSLLPPGPSPMPNMMIPSMSDTMRLLRPEFDMKKRNRKSILDLGLPRPSSYQATHIPSQMPPQLQQQMMNRPPVAHLPSMTHLPPSAHMPPGPQGPRAFQMQRHMPPHLLNQIQPAHSMHSNPVRMAPPNVTVLPPNMPSNILLNPMLNANEPIIPTTVLSVANKNQVEPPTSTPSSVHPTSGINSIIPPLKAPNTSNPQPSAEALNAASLSELDALKRRGRRKKITPLRDPSKPNPGLADLSQAHGVPVTKATELHSVQVEKKSNPILAERLTASPAGGLPESPVKSALVTTTSQAFPPRASVAASVITRLQQPPRPHQPGPFSQAPSRYFPPTIIRPPHPARPPFSGNPPPGMPPVTEPGPHYLTSDSRQPGGGHMFRPSLLHGFSGPSNPLHPLQVPSTQAHLVRGPTPPRDYSGGPTHPPPSFSTPTSQYGDFYPSPNQAVPAIPSDRHQPPSPEHPPPFDQYEPLKSIPVAVAENASQFETTNDDDTGGDGSCDGGNPGDGADGNSNSGPTSEFSGLVSYFSSQQDDLDT